MSSVKKVEAGELKAMLHDGTEIAVLDAREEGDFATSHLLFACSVPLSQLERLLALRVPRRAARVVWMDAGEGFAQAAAARSAAFGYQDVSVLEGGVEAWRMAGYQVYTGVHVPSKAFAEVVEHDEHTPWISAQALCEKAAADPDLVLLDSRSYEEYHSNTIPGARSCPGAELVYRIQDIVPSADALVVVNCGGRTRSIIGAQSLINAGLPNQVVSLRDGTMAWHLTGMEVAIGRQEKPPATSSAGLQWAQEATERVAKRFAVERIDAEVLGRWLLDTERTLYVIDVRTAEEYQAGHIESARWVGGGQLVQETDQHIGVWGARVVLTDDDAVRATMTASWLKQMGWEAYVFVPDATYPRIAGMPSSTALSVQHTTPPSLTAAQLASALEGADAPLVVDIGTSVEYANEHIAGAWFATRARLELGGATLPDAETLVVTSADGELASFAVAHLLAQGRSASALAGGTQAWVAARLPLENGMTRPACPANDLWHTPRGRDPQRREAAMREYLTWETALVFQIKQDDDCRFQSFPA